MKAVKITASFEYIKLPSSEELVESRDEMVQKWISEAEEELDGAGYQKLWGKASRAVQEQYQEVLNSVAKFVIDRQTSQEIVTTIRRSDPILLNDGCVIVEQLVRVNPEKIYEEPLYQRERTLCVYAGSVLLCVGGSYFVVMSHDDFSAAYEEVEE